MTRYDRRTRILAASLSALAGFVDSIGFLSAGGFFVSFMSGNSTRLAVGAADRLDDAAIAASLIGSFVVGVIAGSLLGHAAGARRRQAVLFLLAALLAAAAGLGTLGSAQSAVLVMALAMGAENAIFERDGEVQIGLTYMTGTLVKLGQRIAAALRGGDRFAWVSYLFLWLGLVAGAIAGAWIYPRLGLDALWIAAAFAAFAALVVQKIAPAK